MIDFARYQKMLEGMRDRFPQVGRFLDGKLQRGDLEYLERAFRAGGEVELAEGLRMAREDPTALVDAVRELAGEEFGPMLSTAFEAMNGLQRVNAILQTLKRQAG